LNKLNNLSRINQQQQLMTSPPKKDDLIDGASMLSQNEWVEVINYQRELDEEKMQREKEAKERVKQLNRHSLEQQLADKRQRALQEKEAQKHLEQQIIQTMKEKEFQDYAKKAESLNKAQQQKIIREQQLRDALSRKQNDFISKQQNDLLTINKLHLEVEQDRER
jgi:hypothetical protein